MIQIVVILDYKIVKRIEVDWEKFKLGVKIVGCQGLTQLGCLVPVL